jgi:hypothetical protein
MPEFTHDPKPVEEIARIAAKWWADLLRVDVMPSLVKDAGYATDGPESHLRGMMGDGLVAMIRSTQKKMTMEACQVFEDALAKIILDGLDGNDPEWRERKMTGRLVGFRACGRFTIEVDYDPDWALFVAAKRAGLDDDGAYRFPYKTRMRGERTHLSVAQGYGALHEYLWATTTDAARMLAGEKFSREYSPYDDPGCRKRHDEATQEEWKKALDRYYDGANAIATAQLDASLSIEEMAEQGYQVGVRAIKAEVS